MYYFKRIYFSDYALHEEKLDKKDTKNLNKLNPDTSVPDISDDEEDGVIKTMPNQSYLQLVRYNLVTKREVYIKDYCLLEKDGPLRAVFNMNYGEQYILFSTKSDLHKKLMDNSRDAIKQATEAHDKFESSTVIVDLNQMEYLFQIGNSTEELIDEVNEMKLVADYSSFDDDDSDDRTKQKLDDLKEMQEFDTDNLYEAENILFKSQYFSVFQLASSES